MRRIREKHPWYSSVFARQVRRLANLMAMQYGYDSVTTVVESVKNNPSAPSIPGVFCLFAPCFFARFSPCNRNSNPEVIPGNVNANILSDNLLIHKDFCY
jgi:hypothetical protein